MESAMIKIKELCRKQKKKDECELQELAVNNQLMGYD